MQMRNDGRIKTALQVPLVEKSQFLSLNRKTATTSKQTDRRRKKISVSNRPFPIY